MPIIDDIFFEKFPFPCLIVSDRFNSSIVGGALFPPSQNLISEKQILFYKETHLGWSTCPLGYAVYAIKTGVLRETKMIFFGLKVKGVSKVAGKNEFLSIKINRSDLETFVKGNIESVQKIENRLQGIVSSGIHEVRNINKDIYHISYEVSESIANNGFDHNYQKKITSIIHLSEMLKTRSDVFDALTV